MKSYSSSLQVGIGKIEGRLEVKEDCLFFNSPKIKTKVPFEGILYMEVNGKKLDIDAVDSNNHVKRFLFHVDDLSEKELIKLSDEILEKKIGRLKSWKISTKKIQSILYTSIGKLSGQLELMKDFIYFSSPGLKTKIPYESVFSAWRENSTLEIEWADKKIMKRLKFTLETENDAEDVVRRIYIHKRKIIGNWRPKLEVKLEVGNIDSLGNLPVKVAISNEGKLSAKNVRIRLNTPLQKDVGMSQQWNLKRIDPRETRILETNVQIYGENSVRIGPVHVRYTFMGEENKVKSVIKKVKPPKSVKLVEDILRVSVVAINEGMEVQLELDPRNKVKDIINVVKSTLNLSTVQKYSLYKGERKLLLDKRISDCEISDGDTLVLARGE
ncbi:MAG: hypothetical protein ACE5K4_00680 [Candidatus Hydrothermarchaeota archaeon]